MPDVPVTPFDAVNTPVDQIDLTNSLIMHSVITRLQDEVRYWRENAACWLSLERRARAANKGDGQ